MPNIKIYGAHPKLGFEGLRSKIDGVMKDLGLESKSITTFIPAITKHCRNDKVSPYLEVRDEKEEVALKVAKALNETLEIEVEVVVIRDFLPVPSLPEE